MRIELEKRGGGDVVMRCMRNDGTSDWQRQRGQRARFFPLHDLTHFAVETTLNFTNGFFGLISQGWTIVDTTGKGARGELPAEALITEHIVALIERETLGGAAPLAADQFNQVLAAGFPAELKPGVPELTDDQLNELRRVRSSLQARWLEMPEGEKLILEYDVSATDSTRPRPSPKRASSARPDAVRADTDARRFTR